MDEIKGWKLLLSYDVKEEHLQEYYQFVMGRYLPAMQSMGLQMSEAWHTAYGAAPSRLIGFVCGEQETIYKALASELWSNMNEQLVEFVSDFDYKMIPYRGGFQL
jgi:hypothetical protein